MKKQYLFCALSLSTLACNAMDNRTMAFKIEQLETVVLSLCTENFLLQKQITYLRNEGFNDTVQATRRKEDTEIEEQRAALTIDPDHTLKLVWQEVKEYEDRLYRKKIYAESFERLKKERDQAKRDLQQFKATMTQ